MSLINYLLFIDDIMELGAIDDLMGFFIANKTFELEDVEMVIKVQTLFYKEELLLILGMITNNI